MPRTVHEFQQYWRNSPEFKALESEIAEYETQSRLSSETQVMSQLRQAKHHLQAKYVRPRSPYTISSPMQIHLCTKRAYQRIWNDRIGTVSTALSGAISALIVGSVFYGAPDTTASMSSKGPLLFIAVLIQALTTVSEIVNLYAQRPVVEKHASWAFYRPSAEAIAGIVTDVPIKFIQALAFNVLLYFLGGLRREPGPFFLYYLVIYMTTFVMSAIFRTLAAVTTDVSQAMAPGGIVILALVMYSGLVIPVPQMKSWFGWIRWINPAFYGFEILVANEFHNREFPCASIIPPYGSPSGNSWICSIVGAVAGRETVNGDAYIAMNYGYSYGHVWRNIGILVAFLVGFLLVYFAATEHITLADAAAEVLVFRKGYVPLHLKKQTQSIWDEENIPAPTAVQKVEELGNNVQAIEQREDTFSWRDIVYDIKVKGEDHRLLDHVSGWVKPGTLTALMGVSGAGKTTLLNVLAQRTTVGVVTGDMFINAKPLDASFQRKSGYVQQQGWLTIFIRAAKHPKLVC